MKQKYSLSEDEIIRDWSLNIIDDLAFLKKFRKQYQLWGYLQVCALRLFGQLLDNPNTLDTRIIVHASKSLGLGLVGTADIPMRDATRTDYKKSIFLHLHFKPFNDTKAHFYAWLQQKMQAGVLIPDKLIPDAETFLIASTIALPALYYLKREINSFCSQHQEKIFVKIYQQLSEALLNRIDEVLEIIPGEEITWFQKFKEYPGSSSISVLQDYLLRYQKIKEIDLSIMDAVTVPPDLAKHLYQLAKHYDAYRVKRFKPAKRYALMILFLDESRKVLMDYIIQLHDQYISNVCRECQNAHMQNLKLYKHKNERAIDKIERFIDFVLAQKDDHSLLVNDLYSCSIQKSDLQQARNDMHEYQMLSRFGYAKLIQNRYSSMRRYFANLIQLSFLVEKGSHALEQAIHLIPSFDNQESTKIPNDIDTKFMDKQLTVAMRAGDLYVGHNNKYTSFWNLIYQDNEWQQEKNNSYQVLGITQNAKQAVGEIVENFHHCVEIAAKHFKNDDFADIRNNKLILKKKDKIDIPYDVQRLQSLISSYLPKIKIEQLLIEVDRRTGFTKHFAPMHGQKGRPKNFYKTLIASILAQATNIGLVTMQDCVPGITAKMMRHVTDSCIRETTIKAANAELVNQHTQLDLSQNYGDGKMSSSDGQRFIITASSLLSSYYPRYAGEPVIEQFDQMVRVAASLKKKLSPAHEIIRWLSKGSPTDKLSKAFTQLGRILKTEYILQYITDSKLRDKVQRHLNKGEHRHQLARSIFFANQEKCQVGDC